MALSARRERILQRILPEVVPSAYPSEAFSKIDKNWKPGAGYTTCGGLPTFVAKELGITPAMEKEGLGLFGLATIRNAGITRGAWRHQNMTLRSLGNAMKLEMARPQPGDFYMLCSGDRHDTGCNCIAPVKKEEYGRYRGAHIEHVGVIVDATSNLWMTADAGQPGQSARFMPRTFDPASGFMTGEAGREGKPMRRLCGWFDVDAYPFLR
ncbi:MAG TPA: hypothetical protein VGM87_01630 [Roseomonas sp.]|jgi:hypothetical protein